MKKLILLVSVMVVACMLHGQVMSLPFFEDFDGAGTYPAGWNGGGIWGGELPPGSNAVGVVLGNPAIGGTGVGNVMTPTVGPIEIGTILEFQYRIISRWAPHPGMNAGDVSLQVRVNEQTILNIFEQHVQSDHLAPVMLNLSAFAGQEIRIEFLATWHNGLLSLTLIDDVHIHTIDIPDEYDLVASSISGSVIPFVNENTTYSIVVSNAGLLTASDYTVKLMQAVAGDEDIMLSSAPGMELSSGSVHTFHINWTPLATGDFQIYGFVDVENGINPETNRTRTLDISVFPTTNNVVFIGSEEEAYFDRVGPFNYNYINSVYQHIYLHDEITSGGTISHIMFRFNGAGDVLPNLPVRLYLATTTEVDEFLTNSSWLPYNQFTRVFTGTLPVNIAGQADILIALDQPYLYTGGNLVIMAHRVDYQNTSFAAANGWQTTNTPDVSRTLREATSLYSLNPATDYYDWHGSWREYHRPNVSFVFDTANTGTLKGWITHDGEPLPDVQVAVTGTQIKTFSDSEGFYELSYLQAGPVSITASKHSFYNVVLNDVVIVADQIVYRDIEMQLALYDIEALEIMTHRYVTALEPNRIFVKVRNNAVISATNYEVVLMQVLASGDVEVHRVSGEPIEFDEVRDILVPWAPPVTGIYEIYGQIIFDLDEDPLNDKTTSVIVEALPSGTNYTYIGNPNSTHRVTNVPFNYWFEASISQSIYLEKDIGARGSIVNITYRFLVDGVSPPDEIVELYLATTDMDFFPNGNSWLSINEFTPVYSGPLPVTSDNVYISFDLDTPFLYEGGNLVIFANRPAGDPDVGSQFQGTQTTFGEIMTLSHGRVSSYNLNLLPSGAEWPHYANIAINFLTYYGTLEGVVTHNGSPLEGVEVVIEGTNRKAVTDATGEYRMERVPHGTYTVTASKYAFYTTIKPNVVIIDQETEILPIEMNAIPRINVTGTVIASDTGSPLAGAAVSLTGYADYTGITTNAQGRFTIPEVYIDLIYTLTVSISGYDLYVDPFVEIPSTSVDFDIGTITLVEKANRPRRVRAVDASEYLNLSWETPQDGPYDWITHSVGDPTLNGIGFNDYRDFEIAHRYSEEHIQSLGLIDADLISVGFVGRTSGLPPSAFTYTIKVYTEGSESILDPGRLIHQQTVPSNIVLDQQWTEVELTKPIAITDLGELWIVIHIASAASFPAGVDNGPYIENHQFGNLIKYAEDWTTMVDMNPALTYNFMIKGLVNGVATTGDVVLSLDRPSVLPTTPQVASTISHPAVASSINTDGDALLLQAFTGVAFEHTTPSSSSFPTIFQGASHELLGSQRLEAVATSSISQGAPRELLGYNIWRVAADLVDDESAWNMLDVGHVGTTFQDHEWAIMTAGVYIYIVQAAYTNNNLSLYAFSNRIEKPVDDFDKTTPPVSTVLKGNYPNPFNPFTTIAFDKATEGNVRIDVYNIRGQRVRNLINEDFGIGSHRVVWNGDDDSENPLSSGIYFYRMQTDDYTSVRRMLLMK